MNSACEKWREEKPRIDITHRDLHHRLEFDDLAMYGILYRRKLKPALLQLLPDSPLKYSVTSATEPHEVLLDF